MRKSTITIIVCSVITALALAGAGVAWGVSANALGSYKMQLEYVYQRNFLELTDNINNIESNLSKLNVATNDTIREKYLVELVSLSDNAQGNLAALPIDHNAIDTTIQFINQLGGFCTVLNQKLSAGQTVTLDEYDQIASLHTSGVQVKYELNRLAVMIAGGYSIVENLQNPNVASGGFSSEWGNLANNMVEYPQLIYDGPFSASVTNKQIKGLSENEITQTDAELKLKEWFADYEVKYTNDSTGGDFDTFNFSLKKGDKEYYAQITKRDGILLQFNGGVEAKDPVKSTEECESLAEKFAMDLDFKDMKAVWSTSSNGFVYVNLTPYINNVIIYPDIIKVKVAQDTGEVVGWEARSWAFNHVERSNLTPSVSLDKARKAVSTDMDIRTEKIAIIPGDYIGEALTYEFMCAHEGNTYYIYIDAVTGKQVNVLKVIETDDGNMLM